MEPGQCCSYGEHSPECPCESRIAELEAEVERLRHLGGEPPGVSPSPPHSRRTVGSDGILRCTDCGAQIREGRFAASKGSDE